MAGALVLGSSGMVGRAVAARLRERKVDIIGANRSGRDGALAFDAAEPPPLDTLIAGADLVVNAVGLLRSEPDYPGDSYTLRATRVNAVFPLLLAQAASEQGARIVHISTDAVFGPGGEPADETTAVSPTEPYGLTKALGEAHAAHVINIRCSVVGPAPGRRSLWEWFATQPEQATVEGFDVSWTGVTSRQLAVLCGDLLDRGVFERVRAAGATHHFVPNEPITKFELFTSLGTALRPDITVVSASAPSEGRQLISRANALNSVFSGPRGWKDALADALATR